MNGVTDMLKQLRIDGGKKQTSPVNPQKIRKENQELVLQRRAIRASVIKREINPEEGAEKIAQLESIFLEDKGP